MLFAWLALARAGLGCADEDTASSTDPHSPPLLAQVAAPTEVVTTIDTPVLAPDKPVLPIEVRAIFGVGCTGRATPSVVKGRLEISFQDFAIRFDQSTGFGLQSTDCQIQLKVYGAAGYRYAVENVGYLGIANWRTANTQGTLEARYFWSGRATSMPAGAEQQWTIPEAPGGHRGRFVRKHELLATQQTWSKCASSDVDWDAVTIDVVLTLDSDPVEPAELRMSFLSTEILGTNEEPLGERVTAPIIMDLAAQPCAPSGS